MRVCGAIREVLLYTALARGLPHTPGDGGGDARTDALMFPTRTIAMDKARAG